MSGRRDARSSHFREGACACVHREVGVASEGEDIGGARGWVVQGWSFAMAATHFVGADAGLRFFSCIAQMGLICSDFIVCRRSELFSFK